MPLLFYFIHEDEYPVFTHEMTWLDDETCKIRCDSFPLMYENPVDEMNRTKVCSMPDCTVLKKQKAANTCKEHKKIYPKAETQAAKMFLRTGYRNVYQKKSTQEASKKTMEERHDASHPMHVEEFKNKIRYTNSDRYGYSHHFCSNARREEIQTNAQKTRHMKKYGNENGPIEFREEWRKIFLKDGMMVALDSFPEINTGFCYRYFITEDEKKKGSIIQQSVQKQIENLTDLSFESNVRNILPSNGRLEIDFVNHEQMISFEFNGIYWHRDSQKKDLSKAEEMRSIGYRHFVLDETTIHLIPKLSKMISPNKKRVFARKCKIVDIENATSIRPFLNDYHLQGFANSSVKLGLFDEEDELVQLMTFGKPRYNKNIDWELIRLATRSDSLVVGGAERMFAHFRKNHIGSIVSFSDNRWFDGSVYDRLGMRYEGNTSIGYVWKNDDIELTRYETMKHKLPVLLGEQFDDSLTEAQNMESAGFRMIADLGQKKWVSQ